ncbi:IS630 family transposase [Actinomadura formosensis]|uniref:IS630 family transposase n=1 Tax=Actinomadura formosensis TaxID=60706 RepID=UPI00082C0895|nr:IS630 family transposase [Actinomadura formosensis]
MPSPKLEPVVLSEEERSVLTGWVRRRKTSQALALRARIVLLCAEGGTIARVAEQAGTSRNTVSKWRSRFLAGRLEGLTDEPRPGRPRVITDEQVERVVTATLQETPGADTHWSTRSMAAATGMSQPAVSRIWRAFGLTPHTVQTWKLPAGPQFVDKVRDVVGLYLVLDNYATHKTEQVHKWLIRHPRFHLHFTPTSSSWLNLVERWFAEITNRKLRRSAHRSIIELERDVRGWINEWNTDPKPFVWTKPADEILETLTAYCQIINDSRH